MLGAFTLTRYGKSHVCSMQFSVCGKLPDSCKNSISMVQNSILRQYRQDIKGLTQTDILFSSVAFMPVLFYKAWLCFSSCSAPRIPRAEAPADALDPKQEPRLADLRISRRNPAAPKQPHALPYASAIANRSQLVGSSSGSRGKGISRSKQQ